MAALAIAVNSVNNQGLADSRNLKEKVDLALGDTGVLELSQCLLSISKRLSRVSRICLSVDIPRILPSQIRIETQIIRDSIISLQKEEKWVWI